MKKLFFILIILFFTPSLSSAVTYHESYESARAAEPCQTGLINQGECWRGIKCGYNPVEHVYPRTDCTDEDCWDEYREHLGWICDDTQCIFTLDLVTTGPGSATASKSSADCGEFIQITVTPDNTLTTWELLGCSANCVVSNNIINVTSTVPQDNVIVSILFTGPTIDPDDPNHPCNKDTDGDGVKDYLDVSNDHPNNISQYIEVTRIEKKVDGGSAPNEFQYAEYLVRYDDGKKQALLKIGNPNTDLTEEYEETYCNPYTSDCTKYTAGQISSMYPCDPENGQYEVEYPADEQEQDTEDIQEEGEIPGEDSGIDDNGLLEIIANNTGKTVENTAEIAKSSINNGIKLDEINETLKNGITVTLSEEDESEYDYGDPESLSEDDLPGYFTEDNSDVSDLLNDSIESYNSSNDQIDTFVTDLSTDFNSNYSFTLSSPDCSISVSVLDDTLEFDFCPYADHIVLLGNIFRFVIQISLVVMIFRV